MSGPSLCRFLAQATQNLPEQGPEHQESTQRGPRHKTNLDRNGLDQSGLCLCRSLVSGAIFASGIFCFVLCLRRFLLCLGALCVDSFCVWALCVLISCLGSACTGFLCLGPSGSSSGCGCGRVGHVQIPSGQSCFCVYLFCVWALSV